MFEYFLVRSTNASIHPVPAAPGPFDSSEHEEISVFVHAIEPIYFIRHLPSTERHKPGAIILPPLRSVASGECRKPADPRRQRKREANGKDMQIFVSFCFFLSARTLFGNRVVGAFICHKVLGGHIEPSLKYILLLLTPLRVAYSIFALVRLNAENLLVCFPVSVAHFQ